VQKSCPIWIAVNPNRGEIGDVAVEQAMRRVVTLGDGYMTDAVSPSEFRHRWLLIKGIAGELGWDLGSFETSIHGMVNINNNKQIAREESKFYFRHYYGPAWPTEEIIKIWLAHGPPDECADLIQQWIDMGITTPVLRFTGGDQLGQIRRFINEVLPRLSLPQSA